MRDSPIDATRSPLFCTDDQIGGGGGALSFTTERAFASRDERPSSGGGVEELGAIDEAGFGKARLDLGHILLWPTCPTDLPRRDGVLVVSSLSFQPKFRSCR